MPSYKRKANCQKTLSFKQMKQLLIVIVFSALPCQLLASSVSAPSMLSQPAHNSSVGATAGEHSIGPDGRLNYTVPINVVPGVQGVQPKLDLVYSDKSGKSAMGRGWSIRGLSTIQRCPTDKTRGENPDPVDFDDNDKFCLDGIRLVLKQGGLYGGNGTEYALENEQFWKIVSYGNINGSPEKFKVWTSDGRIREYGYTATSRLKPSNNSGVLTWALNKESDYYSNYFIAKYEQPINSNNIRISEIEYTGNINAGLIPSRKILFKYKNVFKAQSIFIGGNESIVNWRLNSIDHLSLGNMVKQHRFDYTGFFSNEDLKSVQECAGNSCLPKTEFEWSADSYALSTTPYSGGGLGGHPWNRVGDFNGDGIQDIASPTGSTIYLKLGKKTGGFTTYTRTGLGGWGGAAYTYAADFNGDGFTDLASAIGDKVYMKFSTGSNFNGDVWKVANTWGAWGHVGDFNGDGRPDIASGGVGKKVYIKLNNGTGFDSLEWNTDGNWGRADYVWVADFNNDGKDDIASAQGTVVYVKYSTGTGFTDGGGIVSGATADAWGGSGTTYIGDFNGDGLLDIGSVRDDFVYLKVNNGNGKFVADFWEVSGSWGASGFFWSGDYNRDGLTDFAAASGGEIIFQFSTGSGFVRRTKSSGSTSWGHSLWVLQGDFNGDGATDLASFDGGIVYLRSLEIEPKSLQQVTLGTGHTTKFEYSVLTDTDVYSSPGSTSQRKTYPLKDINSPNRVIKYVETSDGLGGYLRTSYKYKNLRTHLSMWGDLGFEEFTTRNNDTGIETIVTNSQDYGKRTHGLANMLRTVAPGGVELSKTTNIWQTLFISTGASSRGYSRVKSTEVIKRDLDGSFLSREFNNYTYNFQNQPKFIETKLYDSEFSSTPIRTKTIDNVYKNLFSESNQFWHLPAITDTEVKVTVLNKPTITSYFQWDYDHSTGRQTVAKELLPSNHNIVLKSTEYKNVDSYGNHTRVTVSGSDFSTRETEISYNYNNQQGYLVSITSRNELDYPETEEFYPAGVLNTGLPKFTTDINGFKTFIQYDAFGREIKKTSFYGSPQPLESYVSYQWCVDVSDCESRQDGKPVYKVTSSVQGGGIEQVFVDNLGRTVRKSVQGPDGELVNTDIGYNHLGRQTLLSQPYKNGENRLNTTIEYDILGRKIRVENTNSSVDRIEYQGLQRTSCIDCNGKNQTKIEFRDSMDNLLRVEDNLQGSIYYDYDSLARLTHTTDDFGNTTLVTYDERGLKNSVSDPNKGTWSYTYNGLGEMITQTDGNGTTICTAYDSIGRMIRRADYFQGTISSSVGMQSEASQGCINHSSHLAVWEYNNDLSASLRYKLGTLHRVQGALGDVTEYKYNSSNGGIAEKKNTISGNIYYTNTTYDSYHRVDRLTYPGASNRLVIQSIYNSVGFNFKLKNFTTGKVYYEVRDVDSKGNVTELVYGNGVSTNRVFDSETNRLDAIQAYSSFNIQANPDVQDLDFEFDVVGNLKDRKDYLQNISEDFTYDGLNRLRFYNLNMGNGQVQQIETRYNAIGNITYKTGVGTYSYGGICNNVQAGPSAVTHITSPKNTTYCYDRNGSMTSGDGRVVAYSAFDKPVLTFKGSNHNIIYYGAERQRFLRFEKTNGVDSVYHYVNGIYEKKVTGSIVSERHFIGGVAVLKIENRTSSSSGNSQENYLHTDHLGSVTVITDSLGAVSEEFSFDPWGKRRAPNLSRQQELLGPWSSMNFYQRANLTIGETLLSSEITNKGFTGHEQLDGVGLIHMNGRVYDAEIGRFISADPFVQDATNLQALNRYSYVQNNPLSYTDPSGYFLKSINKAIAKVIEESVRAVKNNLQSIGKVINAVPGLSAVVGLVITSFCPSCGPAYFKYLAVLNASIAAANGASPGTILTQAAVGYAAGGVSAGLSSIVGSKLIGGIMASGIITKAQGGQFIDGVRNYTTGVFVVGMFAAIVGPRSVNVVANSGSSRASATRSSSNGNGGALGRALTTNEIAAARYVYGNNIDYSKVRIFSRKFLFFQGKNVFMSPDGNIYDPRGAECSDYTLCTVLGGNQQQLDSHGTFIHEMGHVAQVQAGVNVFWRGLIQQTLYRVTLGLYNPYQVTQGNPPPITNVEAYAEYNRKNYCSARGLCNGW